MCRYLILYTSKTGNTKKLASEMFAALPGTSKDCYELSLCPQGKTADIYLIGFWVDRGTCSMEVIDFLSELHGKKVVLFGTCGMGTSEDYYCTILEKVRVFLPEDNEYLGGFLCQGKMPMQVRNKYEMMKNNMNSAPNAGQIDEMIRNFDEALLHPNKEDFLNVKNFLNEIFEKIILPC